MVVVMFAFASLPDTHITYPWCLGSRFNENDVVLLAVAAQLGAFTKKMAFSLLAAVDVVDGSSHVDFVAAT